MKKNISVEFLQSRNPKLHVLGLILFFLFFQISFLYGQNTEDVIQIQGGAVIFSENNEVPVELDKNNAASQPTKLQYKKSFQLKRSPKTSTKKMLAVSEDLQKEKLKKVINGVKISLMKFHHQSTTNDTVENFSAKKITGGTTSYKYVFAKKNFILNYITVYIYRDVYDIESPKFSKDVSNFISGRAPPTDVFA